MTGASSRSDCASCTQYFVLLHVHRCGCISSRSHEAPWKELHIWLRHNKGYTDRGVRLRTFLLSRLCSAGVAQGGQKHGVIALLYGIGSTIERVVKEGQARPREANLAETWWTCWLPIMPTTALMLLLMCTSCMVEVRSSTLVRHTTPVVGWTLDMYHIGLDLPRPGPGSQARVLRGSGFWLHVVDLKPNFITCGSAEQLQHFCGSEPLYMFRAIHALHEESLIVACWLHMRICGQDRTLVKRMSFAPLWAVDMKALGCIVWYLAHRTIHV